MPWTASVTSIAPDSGNGNILVTFSFTDGTNTEQRIVPSSTWDTSSIAAYAQTIIAQLDARDVAFAAIQTGAVAIPSDVTTALQAVWSAKPDTASGDAFADGDTAAQKLAKINAWMVAGPKQDVQIASVLGYLALNAKTIKLQAYALAAQASATPTTAQVSGMELISTLTNPNAQPFRMSDATVYATISGMLSALVSDPNSGLTSDDEAALLALAATTTPWWKSIGSAAPISASIVAAANLS